MSFVPTAKIGTVNAPITRKESLDDNSDENDESFESGESDNDNKPQQNNGGFDIRALLAKAGVKGTSNIRTSQKLDTSPDMKGSVSPIMLQSEGKFDRSSMPSFPNISNILNLSSQLANNTVLNDRGAFRSDDVNKVGNSVDFIFTSPSQNEIPTYKPSTPSSFLPEKTPEGKDNFQASLFENPMRVNTEKSDTVSEGPASTNPKGLLHLTIPKLKPASSETAISSVVTNSAEKSSQNDKNDKEADAPRENSSSKPTTVIETPIHDAELIEKKNDNSESTHPSAINPIIKSENQKTENEEPMIDSNELVIRPESDLKTTQKKPTSENNRYKSTNNDDVPKSSDITIQDIIAGTHDSDEEEFISYSNSQRFYNIYSNQTVTVKEQPKRIQAQILSKEKEYITETETKPKPKPKKKKAPTAQTISSKQKMKTTRSRADSSEPLVVIDDTKKKIKKKKKKEANPDNDNGSTSIVQSEPKEVDISDQTQLQAIKDLGEVISSTKKAILKQIENIDKQLEEERQSLEAELQSNLNQNQNKKTGKKVTKSKQIKDSNPQQSQPKVEESRISTRPKEQEPGRKSKTNGEQETSEVHLDQGSKEITQTVNAPKGERKSAKQPKSKMQANETSRMANTERIAKSPIPNSASQRNGVDLVTSPVTKKKIHRLDMFERNKMWEVQRRERLAQKEREKYLRETSLISPRVESKRMTISEADSFYRRNLEWVENVKSVNQSRAEQSFQEVMKPRENGRSKSVLSLRRSVSNNSHSNILDSFLQRTKKPDLNSFLPSLQNLRTFESLNESHISKDNKQNLSNHLNLQSPTRTSRNQSTSRDSSKQFAYSHKSPFRKEENSTDLGYERLKSIKSVLNLSKDQNLAQEISSNRKGVDGEIYLASSKDTKILIQSPNHALKIQNNRYIVHKSKPNN